MADLALETSPRRGGPARPASISFLLTRLALQNLGRRTARTALLLAAIAICTGAIFTGIVLLRSIEGSMAVGFTRLGADMLIVPQGTLANITAALLTAEPTELTLDTAVLARLASLKGISRIAPQLVFRTEASGYGPADEPVDIIAFDPARDLTVQPWLDSRLDRPFRAGDVIIGGRREEPLGSEILVFGRALTVYGKLGKSAVGTHARGLFIAFSTLDQLRTVMQQICGRKALLEPDRLSGVLVELASGATARQLGFAILANLPDLKVISNESMMTPIRQGLAVLLDGMLGLMVVVLASTALMAGVLFSAIITERRRELGLLKAVGARRSQIVGMLLCESVLATAVGGFMGCLLGVLLLRVFEHSLVYYLGGVGVPFAWLDATNMLLAALSCIIAAAAIGAAAAFLPAWRASRAQAYDLIRSEG
ncbi:MAG: ABC transporter permease [Xanthobacteraceae bacterium]|nr:ABC transporter permease [Xanthobacteraceae bacterium]